MGNCLNLFSSDEDLLLPHSCVSTNNMDRFSSPAPCSSDVCNTAVGFKPMLPFPTPSDLDALYEVGSDLGRGQFGVVRKCNSRVTGEPFACKSISKLHLYMTDGIELVLREISIMKRISNHAYRPDDQTSQGCSVVNLHEVVEDNTFIHLIIDLCNGGELFDQIARKQRYSEAQAAKLMQNLLETLQFCHSLGIMHRDVKPENLLLVDDSDDSSIKLADFGFALEFSPGQKFSDMAGSAYYMAPEVLEGEYSEEVDIWSAGIVMCVLLSGMPPFWGDTEEEIFNAIREGQLVLSSEHWLAISPMAKDLISLMLRVDVTSRCTPAQALGHPWFTCHSATRNKLPPPIGEQSQCKVLGIKNDDSLITKMSVMSEDVAPCRDYHAAPCRDYLHVTNARSLRGITVVNLSDSSTLDMEQIYYAELKMLMESLVVALDKEGLSLSEIISKVRQQFGWTCTILTKSTSEETLMVDMGRQRYLIAHNRSRKILGWKILKRQYFCQVRGGFRSAHCSERIQPL
ncbi:hypothetical protein KP509_30G063400 [Ceratopteris richardii]|uniref:Protein kinase domain-containing protein n=1 Tax=Ceratopteris richardii TaxID=49495 RepID=A0A8T2R4R4_CERRI|nr:hypothetical protein KP509_30G063400 [Ceratopteris richardii]